MSPPLEKVSSPDTHTKPNQPITKPLKASRSISSLLGKFQALVLAIIVVFPFIAIANGSLNVTDSWNRVETMCLAKIEVGFLAEIRFLRALNIAKITDCTLNRCISESLNVCRVYRRVSTKELVTLTLDRRRIPTTRADQSITQDNNSDHLDGSREAIENGIITI